MKILNLIPKPIIINTGEQQKVSKIIDTFFVETKEFIKRNYNVKENEFEIKSGELAYTSSQITDDRVTYLRYRDIPIASVFETRTEFNRIIYNFFRNLDGLEELVLTKQKNQVVV